MLVHSPIRRAPATHSYVAVQSRDFGSHAAQRRSTPEKCEQTSADHAEQSDGQGDDERPEDFLESIDPVAESIDTGGQRVDTGAESSEAGVCCGLELGDPGVDLGPEDGDNVLAGLSANLIVSAVGQIGLHAGAAVGSEERCGGLGCDGFSRSHHEPVPRLGV